MKIKINSDNKEIVIEVANAEEITKLAKEYPDFIFTGEKNIDLFNYPKNSLDPGLRGQQIYYYNEDTLRDNISFANSGLANLPPKKDR